MDKTESYLTQAIVGKRQRLVLGSQVRYEGETVLAVTNSSRFMEAVQASGIAIYNLWRGGFKWVALTAATAGIAAGGTWVFLHHADAEIATAPPSVTTTEAPAVASLPIAPAPVEPEPVTAITVAAEPFQIEEGVNSEPISVSGTASLAVQLPEGPLPVAQQSGVAPAPSAGRPLPSAPVAQAPIRLGQPAPMPGSQKDASSKRAEKNREEPQKGLVLDAGKDPFEKQAGTKTQADAVAPGTVAKGGKLVDPIDVGATGSGPSSPSTAAPRPTIVTIAEDNSYVLITNPNTRLPQKFQVGQKLPTGATVQKIDHAKGTVQIDGQTFGLQ